jgi:hypothetical protein
MKRATRVYFVIAFALLLMLTPLLACGGGAAPPPSTPPPSGNQAPVINVLAAEKPTLTPNAETKVTCDATDPDGDELTYTWSASAGTITETYKTFIFWKAPGFVGDFQVSVTVDDGKGGTVSRSCTISVVTDQLPVIEGVTADPATLKPSETSTVTCNAHDPDGDTMTYTWTASGGTISGSGKMITWQAPAATGDFLISVKVDDGKGGVTEGSVHIPVAIPSTTVILTPLPDESGTVYYDGTITSEYKVGDTSGNVGMQPFFSFDTTALSKAEIKEATLVFTVKQSRGNVWSFIPSTLILQCVTYGARPLKPADYPGVQVRAEIAQFHNESPGTVNVQVNVQQVADWMEPRFQARLLMAADSNHNNAEDWIEFSVVELHVNYVK